MKRIFICLLLLCPLITGCTKHYYITSPDNQVTFYLKLKGAEHVYFACSHDNFTLHKVDRINSNLFRCDVDYRLEFRYFYIVDGKHYIPDCIHKEMDDFGSYNCIFIP